MHDARPLTRREWAVISGILLYMTVQVAVPLTQLRFRHHTPFGWKMFAYYGPDRVNFRVVHAGGRTESLESVRKESRVARTLRPEVDLTRVVPPALCAQVPAITAVEFRRPSDSRWQRYSCR